MKVTKLLRKFQDFDSRKLLVVRTNLAANAGSSQVAAVAVPTNQRALVRGVVRAAAGVVGAAIAGTVDATANTFTASAVHGYAGTVVPGFVSGTVLPTGWTAATLYYAAIKSTTALKLYDTLANAIADDGATGLIDPTTTGTDVKFTPTVINAEYQVFGAVANREATCALVGTPVVDSLEVISGWACAIQADNTNKALQVMVTPDTAIATRVEVQLEVFVEALDVI